MFGSRKWLVLDEPNENIEKLHRAKFVSYFGELLALGEWPAKKPQLASHVVIYVGGGADARTLERVLSVLGAAVLPQTEFELCLASAASWMCVK